MSISTIFYREEIEIEFRNDFLKICVQSPTYFKNIFPPHFARTRAHNQLNKPKQQLIRDLPLSNNEGGLQGRC